MDQTIINDRIEACLTAYEQAIIDTSNDKLPIARHNAAINALNDAYSEINGYGYSIRYTGIGYVAIKRED